MILNPENPYGSLIESFKEPLIDLIDPFEEPVKESFKLLSSMILKP